MAGADAIVVLGAALRPDGSPSAALQRRVAKGIALWQAGAAPILVMIGGAVSHARTEAEVMAELAIAAGVDPAAVIQEPQSRRTIENAGYTAKLAGQHGWQRLLLVTDACHMPRALLSFRGFGLDCKGASVWSGDWRRAGVCLREVVGLFFYALYEIRRAKAGLDM